MTDDNNPRYRPREHLDPATDPANADPLAELARLIGRHDIYADQPRDPHADAPHEHHEHHHEPHYADEPQAPSDWHADTTTAPAANYDEPEPAVAPSRAYVPEPHFEPRTYEPPPRSQPAWSTDEPYRVPQYRRTDPAPLPDDFGAPAFHHNDAVTAHDNVDPGPMPPPHVDDPLFEEPPARSRSRGVATMVVVLALAAIGCGAAFAYRTYFTFPSSTPAAAPVIRASSEPTKVTPPPSETPANKLSYDRFGDRSKNEQVVVREEKPLDPKNLVTAAPPPSDPPPTATPQFGSVPPPAFPPVVMPSNAAPQQPQATANPPSVLTEPKRIRTVTVRPDQPDPTAQPQTLGTTTPSRRQTTATVTPPPPPAANPLEIMEQPAPQTPPSRAATARAQTRAAVPPALAQNPPAHNPNAPLSLAPDGPSAPSRSVRAAAPAPAASKTGNYLVQVASQKSEADAQSAFRSVKSKYSSVLGNREPTIRRADLGAKGVYYRAMVGPFSTREQAIQMCASLKSAGGDCVVQSN